MCWRVCLPWDLCSSVYPNEGLELRSRYVETISWPYLGPPARTTSEHRRPIRLDGRAWEAAGHDFVGLLRPVPPGLCLFRRASDVSCALYWQLDTRPPNVGSPSGRASACTSLDSRWIWTGVRAHEEGNPSLVCAAHPVPPGVGAVRGGRLVRLPRPGGRSYLDWRGSFLARGAGRGSYECLRTIRAMRVVE